MKQRALIVKFGAIGDVIMALPAAKLLYDNGMQIDWVCGAAVRPLLSCYSWLNVLPVDDRALVHGSFLAKVNVIVDLWKRLALTKYELCATLYYDNRYKVLTLPIRAVHRIKLSQADRQNKLLPGRHHTDEYARILLQSLGKGEDGYVPQSLPPQRPDKSTASPLPAKGNTARIVLVPGGARNMMRDDALRRWPIENYVRLARLLLERGCEVLLAGGPDDHWIDIYFADLPVANLVGAYSLPELVGLFNDTDIVITHDTGPLHLAGITKSGIISIFGPTNPWEKLPRRPDSIALWGGEGFACRPCYDGINFAICQHNGCMHQITVEMIIRELSAMLERRALHLAIPARIVLPDIAGS